ncbi:MAG: hypothetical protein HZA66_21820 [Rhodopseudomonas palustris]|uniref:Uncharacterized protein n=1 Tax=Rhodopseudomonas palustris TaxID=1076 RepID=A0A933S1Q2_RHOPL|nr:hypothetical protein [Rhodopseudomonas palustris]
MAQKQQRDGSDRLWLETLIESFEAASRSDVRAVPCDSALLRSAHKHLSIRKGPREAGARLIHAA